MSRKVTYIRVLLFCLLFEALCVITLYAQEFGAVVVLKNGTEMNVEIKKVAQWGFILSDDRTLLFKVVRQVSTEDESLIKQITEQVDSLQILNKGATKVLDFEHAQFHKIPKTEGSSVSLKSATLVSVFDYAMSFGGQLGFSFRALEPVIFVPGFSFGNTLGDNYSTLGGSLGAGCLWEYEHSRVILMLNVGDYYIEPDTMQSIELHPVFVSVDQQFLTGNNNKFIIGVGLYCNLNKVMYQDKRRWFGIRLSFGLNMSALSFHDDN